MSKVVMPDLIRHPVLSWIPAFAGMTVWPFVNAGVIIGELSPYFSFMAAMRAAISVAFTPSTATVFVRDA
jgi:hypothetical protein